MIYTLLGAAFAVAGADKLGGDEGYEEMFEELGWSPEAMRATAAAEITGGVLMALPSTRRLGATILAGTSAILLASEVEHGRPRLASARGFLLLAALTALFSRR